MKINLKMKITDSNYDGHIILFEDDQGWPSFYIRAHKKEGLPNLLFLSYHDKIKNDWVYESFPFKLYLNEEIEIDFYIDNEFLSLRGKGVSVHLTNPDNTISVKNKTIKSKQDEDSKGEIIKNKNIESFIVNIDDSKLNISKNIEQKEIYVGIESELDIFVDGKLVNPLSLIGDKTSITTIAGEIKDDRNLDIELSTLPAEIYNFDLVLNNRRYLLNCLGICNIHCYSEELNYTLPGYILDSISSGTTKILKVVDEILCSDSKEGQAYDLSFIEKSKYFNRTSSKEIVIDSGILLFLQGLAYKFINSSLYRNNRIKRDHLNFKLRWRKDNRGFEFRVYEMKIEESETYLTQLNSLILDYILNPEPSPSDLEYYHGFSCGRFFISSKRFPFKVISNEIPPLYLNKCNLEVDLAKCTLYQLEDEIDHLSFIDGMSKMYHSREKQYIDVIEIVDSGRIYCSESNTVGIEIEWNFEDREFLSSFFSLEKSKYYGNFTLSYDIGNALELKCVPIPIEKFNFSTILQLIENGSKIADSIGVNSIRSVHFSIFNFDTKNNGILVSPFNMFPFIKYMKLHISDIEGSYQDPYVKGASMVFVDGRDYVDKYRVDLSSCSALLRCVSLLEERNLIDSNVEHGYSLRVCKLNRLEILLRHNIQNMEEYIQCVIDACKESSYYWTPLEKGVGILSTQGRFGVHFSNV